MEAAELDVQLEELEIRLERLRALYEQYFLGIEKIEPTVPRKDVDRRIYVLRREKIRNTAKRFKLQTIIQRYNTFQQYWQRICREIENGTYKRHVLRAERTVGAQDLLTIAARKRLGKQALSESNPPEAEPADRPSSSPAESPMPSAPPAAPATPVAPAPAAAPAAPKLDSPATPAPIAAAPVPAPREAATAEKPLAPAPAAARRVAAPARARPAQTFESLDLDMDFLGDWDPAAAKPKPQPRPSTPPSRHSVVPPPARASVPPPKAAAPVPAPIAPPKPVDAPKPAAVRPEAPPPAAARPPLARPPAAARPVPKPSPAAAAPAAPAANLSEDRIKELHSRLNDLKRQNKEAGQVSLEGLTKSLRATEEKLRAQHQGRKVDFDVVVKDGKTVVKPIIR